MSLVTVVIPVHNRESLLPHTLSSVLAQTHTDWECIIVDDHSTDDSLGVARRFATSDSRFRVYSLPDPKRGPSAGRNYGLELANGRFINFLDSDDLFAPNKLEKHLQAFQEMPELDVVNCRHAIFTTHETDLQISPFPPQSHRLEYLLLNSDKITPYQSGCPMWRTGRLRDIGGWDEDFTISEDLELFLRAEANRLRILRIEETLYFLRRGTQQRLSWTPHLDRENQRRQMFRKSWPALERAGLANPMRRELCAAKFYRRAYALQKEGHFSQAIRDYIEDSRAIGESWSRTLLGAMLLTSRHYPALKPLSVHLKKPYFRHLQELPDLLSALAVSLTSPSSYRLPENDTSF